MLEEFLENPFRSTIIIPFSILLAFVIVPFVELFFPKYTNLSFIVFQIIFGGGFLLVLVLWLRFWWKKFIKKEK